MPKKKSPEDFFQRAREKGSVDKDRTSAVIEWPDIEGLSMNPKSGGGPETANGVKGPLASHRSTVVSA